MAATRSGSISQSTGISERAEDPSIQARLAQLDWDRILQDLWNDGCALTPAVLTPKECGELTGLYGDDSQFRSHIVMKRYRFGSGDYKYFAYPLPPIIQQLRESAYPPLAPIANAWHEALGIATRFPAALPEFLEVCAEHAQTRPTPLLLHYQAGDYNCLHQDVYGEIAFPLQLTCFLSRKDVDYTGGEFVLVEQQPRAQSRPEVIVPQQGQILIFTTRYRPAKGSRGFYRLNLRHGVSRVRSGTRFTLGLIFHDAA